MNEAEIQRSGVTGRRFHLQRDGRFDEGRSGPPIFLCAAPAKALRRTRIAWDYNGGIVREETFDVQFIEVASGPFELRRKHPFQQRQRFLPV
ncbi:MAG: hypothetical protein BGO11_16880 [Solirubrobacterales bacterium 70-9]|nr:MAG: hypothetical protein BGO11_16880 [Solirubrobacterales bacterium 70-9]